MMTTFGPHGDLGRATSRTNAEEFVDKAIKAAYFLREVANVAFLQNFDVELGLSYSIEFPVGSVKQEVIENAEQSFPTGVRFYSINGQKLFDLRGASGGVTTAQICYVLCFPKEP
jgi:hypothetical protein